MKRLFWTLAIVLALGGCGMSKDEVSATVKQSMQRKLDDDPAFKEFKLKVGAVDVLKQSDHSYKGIAHVQFDGEMQEIPVDIIVDGDSVAWNTGPGAFMFTARRAIQKMLTPPTADREAEAPPIAAAQSISPSPSASDIRLDAPSLFAAYKANEVAADLKYKGKQLLVTGRLESISKDFADDPYLSIQSGNEFESVRANFDKSAIAELATLQRGQIVTLHCTGGGMVVQSPMLNCWTPVEGPAPIAAAIQTVPQIAATPAPSQPTMPAPSFAQASPAAEPAQRPGWCSKAGTSVEKMICADDELSALDTKLGAAFKIAESKADDKKAFYATSRAWRVEQRDRCTAKDCVIDAYQERLADLAAPPRATTGPTPRQTNTPVVVAPMAAPAMPPVDALVLLKARGDALTDQCRNGSGSDPMTRQACDQREVVLSKLKGMGWCWGRTGQYNGALGWVQCRS
ncbi:OB-fold protein [Variovorax sp. PBL-E5]|uniref:OB-fold protein n=1 Tax=Variovorax sp. PBL-E5 TaxID=434014 RepID=UPI001318B13C|nr:lysozyme inhibitor LprI family protein [Variovorax sp. PBL-E5]VTU36138.1 tRNA_anti-like protein [Variovorax sp. PBL-E5]